MSSEKQAQTIAITGGTGFVGRHIVARLLAEGHRVQALTRSQDKARRVLGEDAIDSARVVLCDGTLDDPDALRHLVEGCDACIHLVGIIRETKNQTFEKVHVDGTRAIVEACRQHAPAMRYVHMSALGVGPDKRAGYRDSKHRAGQIVQKSGLRLDDGQARADSWARRRVHGDGRGLGAGQGPAVPVPALLLALEIGRLRVRSAHRGPGVCR
ncbi:MAG: SDR family NAD(P)-dependent oxidoreductase [Phycisphaerales bacterium]